MVFRFKFIILLILLISYQRLETREIIAEGSAVLSSNLANARSSAVDNAHQFALNVFLSSLYGSDVVNENQFKLLDLYENTAPFIISSKIISEEENEDSQTFDVKLQVEFNPNALREYLAERGISLSSDITSRILPLIVEKASGMQSDVLEKIDFTDVERQLARFFAQHNFNFINPYLTSGFNVSDRKLPSSRSYMDLKAPELLSIANSFNAGMVCSGYVWTNCTTNRALNRTDCETNVSLQLLSTDTSKVLAARRVQERSSSSDANEARENSRIRAFRTISDSLLYQLKQNWDKRPAASFKLVVSGIKNYATYLKLRDLLVSRQIAGFTNVVERYQSPTELVFEGERRGELSAISNEIITKAFPDSIVVIVHQDEKGLKLRM